MFPSCPLVKRIQLKEVKQKRFICMYRWIQYTLQTAKHKMLVEIYFHIKMENTHHVALTDWGMFMMCMSTLIQQKYQYLKMFSAYSDFKIISWTFLAQVVEHNLCYLFIFTTS